MKKINFLSTLPYFFGLLFGLLFFSAILANNEFLSHLNKLINLTAKSLTFNIILSLLALGIFISLSLSFLESNSSLKKRKTELTYLSMKLDLEEMFSRLETDLLSSQINITKEEKQNLIDNLIKKIEIESSEEFLKKIKSEIKLDVYTLNFEEKIESTLQRLEVERQSLSKRGSFNLTIGMALSITGLVVFGTILFTSPQYEDIKSLFINTIPKTLFVLLIELFSYFFLNLYKNSLDEIKYYQNEITNLESKYLALRVAKSINNHKLISIIIEELVKTERNFILQKDQTTIELEKKRIDSTNSNNTLQTVKDILKIKN